MTKTTVAILAALTLGLGLSACSDGEKVAATGGSTGTDLPDMLSPAQLAAAGQKSKGVTSGRFSVQLEMSSDLASMFGASGGRTDSSPGNSSGNSSDTSTTTTTVADPSTAAPISTDGEFSGSRTRVALPSGTRFSEAIQDGGTLYVKDDQGWGVLDATTAGTTSPVNPGSIGSSWSTIAPTFDVLAQSGDKVDDLGEETLRGVPTVHRRFETDSSSLATIAAPALGIATDRLPAGLADQITGRVLGDQPVLVEGWFDADGIVHKLHVTVDSPLVSLDETIELWDPNTEITIDLPTGARQLTAADLTGGR